MYHGDVVPGFPQHPHRGFETVTIVRKGYIDHSDSLGATARFGMGDVQWLTAGAGVVHSEMFPLLDRNGPNTLELFQIWLNLPAKNKLADAVLHDVLGQGHPASPVSRRRGDGDRRRARRRGAAGAAAAFVGGERRSRRGDLVDCAGGRRDVDRAAGARRLQRSNRALHLFSGKGIKVGDRAIDGPSMIHVQPDQAVPLEAVDGPVEILLLQGRPIGEPVAQYGPFVMNTQRRARAGVRRLPADAVRRLAVARERACARPRRRPLREARRRPSREGVAFRRQCPALAGVVSGFSRTSGIFAPRSASSSRSTER